MTSTAAPAATTRFLIVDDFATMRRILRNLLVEMGFRQVDEANDGHAALALLQQGGYDFVISDVQMPKMGGFELLKQVRTDAALKDLPVLLITSEASKDDVLKAIRLGANGTILKPLTKSSLEEKVRNILLRSSAWPSCSTPHAAPSPAPMLGLALLRPGQTPRSA